MAASKEHPMFFQGHYQILYIHPLKANNKNVETCYDNCSKLIIKNLERIWAAKSQLGYFKYTCT